MLVNMVNSWLYLLMVATRVISSGDLCCCLPCCHSEKFCAQAAWVLRWQHCHREFSRFLFALACRDMQLTTVIKCLDQLFPCAECQFISIRTNNLVIQWHQRTSYETRRHKQQIVTLSTAGKFSSWAVQRHDMESEPSRIKVPYSSGLLVGEYGAILGWTPTRVCAVTILFIVYMNWIDKIVTLESTRVLLLGAARSTFDFCGRFGTVNNSIFSTGPSTCI